MTFNDFPRRLTTRTPDYPFKFANARFPRILRNYFLQDAFCKDNVAFLKPVLFFLPLGEITPRNFKFLILRVTRQRDYFHAVAQRLGYRAERVRRDNPKHLRQVKRRVNVMVVERIILRGVKHFKQRRRRVARPTVLAELVNFIKQENGIVSSGFFYALNNSAGHCSDVSPPVPANLRLVAYAAQTRADKFSARRLRN